MPRGVNKFTILSWAARGSACYLSEFLSGKRLQSISLTTGVCNFLSDSYWKELWEWLFSIFFGSRQAGGDGLNLTVEAAMPISEP